MPKGIEVNLAEPSLLTCPVHELLAEGLAKAFVAVIRIDDDPAKDARSFICPHDVRVTEWFGPLVQVGKGTEIPPIQMAAKPFAGESLRKGVS